MVKKEMVWVREFIKETVWKRMNRLNKESKGWNEKE